MKMLFLTAILLPSLALSAPFDLLIQQRNIADTATLTRTASLPAFNTPMLMGIDRFTNLPAVVSLSAPFDIQSGQLMVSQTWGDILNKPVFATVATSGDYNDLSNKPTMPSAQVNSDWSSASGVSEVLNKPTTLAGYGISDAYPLSGNPSAFVNQAGARAAITLTTTGTSGAATYNSSTGALNIPDYEPGAGTVTSVTAGAGLSGGTFTTSGTISMPTTGTPGSYSGVTTDDRGRVTAGTNRSQSTATRSLNTAFQVSTTRDADVRYSVQCTITASISGGQACDVILEIASDVGFTANVQTLGIIGAGQTYTLAVALQGVAPQTAQVAGYVPAGYYVRLRTVSVTGSPSYLYRAGQEILQ